jgi:hypothetical protein
VIFVAIVFWPKSPSQTNVPEASSQEQTTTQSTTLTQPAAQQASSPIPVTPTLLTKDSEYMHLINAPTGDDLLANSQGYLQKKKEIDDKLASINDEGLRNQVADQEWAKVDKVAFEQEETANRETAFPAAIQACLLKHRSDWFELGHIDVSNTDRLFIQSVDASPVGLPNGLSIPVTIAMIDEVYSKFHQLAAQRIQKDTNDWLNSEQMSMCRDLAGCNPPTNEEALKKVETDMRQQRITLVGQGDLVAHRIDKLMVVDYDTETILLEVDPKVLAGQSMNWKYCSSSNPYPESSRSPTSAGP